MDGNKQCIRYFIVFVEKKGMKESVSQEVKNIWDNIVNGEYKQKTIHHMVTDVLTVVNES